MSETKINMPFEGSLLSYVLDQMELLLEAVFVISLSASVGEVDVEGGSGRINAWTCVHECQVFLSLLVYYKVKI